MNYSGIFITLLWMQNHRHSFHPHTDSMKRILVWYSMEFIHKILKIKSLLKWNDLEIIFVVGLSKIEADMILNAETGEF